jgi:hypothetical protein
MDRKLVLLVPPVGVPTTSPRPSQVPTVRPSPFPSSAIGPRLTFEADLPNGLASVSCDNSFNNINLLNYNLSPPFLEELTLSFEYEAYISDSADVTEELIKLQALMVGDLAVQTPMIDEEFKIGNMTCNELLLSALDIEKKVSNQNPIRRKRSLVSEEEDWKAFLGLVSEPSPEINPDITCDSTIANTDCHVVIGYVTAQVPIIRELDQDSVIFVMSKIKQSMDEEKYVSSAVPKLSFIGSRAFPLDNTEGERPKAGDPWYFDGDGLSLFGILAIVALVLIFLLTTSLLVMRYKRRNSPQAKLDKIQNDALLIGEDELATPSKSQVFIDPCSPDSVEVVHMNSIPLDTSPTHPSNNVSAAAVAAAAPATDRSKFSIGAFMENIRGRDDISYASGLSFGNSTNFGGDTQVYDDDLSYDANQSLLNKEPTKKKTLAEPITPTRMRSLERPDKL